MKTSHDSPNNRPHPLRENASVPPTDRRTAAADGAIATVASVPAGKDRVVYVDLFRAFGIFLMVAGHVGFGKDFDFWIHAFHMPMFYFVSGFFFRDSGLPWKGFLLKKARSLLLPYAVFGSLYVLADIVLGGFSPAVVWKDVYRLFWKNTALIPGGGALWFLTSLFFADVLYLALSRSIRRSGLSGTRNTLCMGVAVAILGTLGLFWKQWVSFRLPLALDTSLAGLAFYGMGHAWRAKGQPFWWHSWPRRGLLFLAVLAAHILWVGKNGYVNMRVGLYGCPPLAWFNACCAILVFWNLSERLDAFDFPGKKWVALAGEKSIVFLVVNQAVIHVVAKMPFMAPLHGFGRSVAVLLVSVAILYGLVALFSKTKLSVLIGARPRETPSH